MTVKRQALPNVETDTIKMNTIPKSSTTEVAAIEQTKAGNKKVETTDKKDGIDEAHAYMRNSYYMDSKEINVWIPLKERQSIFKAIYPDGSIRSKLTSNSYKSATASTRAYKDYKDDNPMAEEIGSANLKDLPFPLKKKTAQVAVSNAVYRVLTQAGIPQTVDELHLKVVMGEYPKTIKDKLIQDDELLNKSWNALEAKQNKPKQTEDEWVDSEKLIEELEETKLMIDFGNGTVMEQSEVIRVLNDEVFLNENDALIQDIFSILKKYRELKAPQVEAANKVMKIINKKKTPKKKQKATKNYFIARDVKTGHLVKEFSSRADAALWAKVAANSISAAISPSARNRTAGGYYWTKERK